MSRRENNHTSNQIRAIHKAIVKRIMGWGFDVWISHAKKTKSRYFEFFVDGHRIDIRLSDHYSWKGQEFDYDIWVNEPRRHSYSYREWLDDVEKKIKAIREHENERRKTPFEAV